MSINALTHVFEGETLQTLEWDGKPCWVARHIGERLGYANHGKKFAEQIRHDWSDELVEGEDYIVVTGETLSAFKAICFDGPSGGPSKMARRELLLLTERGVHKATLRSRSPVAVDLRAFLAEKVLPQLVRTGQYIPTERQTSVPAPVDEAALLERVDQRITQQLPTLVAAAVTAAMAPVQQLVGQLAELVTTLATSVQSQGQLAAASPTGAVINAPGAHITLVQPEVPEGFDVKGALRLADAEGCSWPKLKRRLQDAKLLDDSDWIRLLDDPVFRGGRPTTEKVYYFRKGILGELHRRERPLFN